MAELRVDLSGLPGTSVTVGQPIGHRIDHMLSGTRAAIAVNLYGPDLHRLRRIARQIETVAAGVPGLVDLAVEQQADVPQLQVRANRRAMARYGVTPAALAQTVDVAFQGEEVSLIREGQRAFGLAVRYDDRFREDPAAIARTLMTTPSGATVPLSQTRRHRAGPRAQRHRPRARPAQDRGQRQCRRPGRHRSRRGASGGSGAQRSSPG